MTTLREAAQQALEALEGKRFTACGWRSDCDKAITALRAALADHDRAWYTIDEINAKFDPKPVQEPVQDWSLLQATQESLREHMAEIQRLRAALAEPVQEPVAWRTQNATPPGGYVVFQQYPQGVVDLGGVVEPLYTAPPKRAPLTEEEIDRVTDQQWARLNNQPIYAAYRAYARAIERAHGITGPEDKGG